MRWRSALPHAAESEVRVQAVCVLLRAIARAMRGMLRHS